MIEMAFKRASELADLTDSHPWEVLITCLTPDVFEELKDYAKKRNKQVTILDRRGDNAKIRSANRDGCILLGHAD
ncbi:hypothetical protein D3C87_1891600 [compost metagenome]